MIYEMLLIQEGGMSIPCDVFARRHHKRKDSVPYECDACGLVFLSRDGCDWHIANRRHHMRPIAVALTKPLLPHVSTSLLQTCRIIRLEASTIFYSRNSFHFCDTATASNFRWAIDRAHAGAIQELGIKFGYSTTKFRSWQTYFTKGPLSLGQDFSNLRRLTIDFFLFRWGAENAETLRSMSNRFRDTSQGLDWVLVLKLRNEYYDIVLDSFEPLVAKEDDPSKGKKEVRRHVWGHRKTSLCKDALLWWGSPGEAVPHKYRAIGDQPLQEASI